MRIIDDEYWECPRCGERKWAVTDTRPIPPDRSSRECVSGHVTKAEDVWKGLRLSKILIFESEQEVIAHMKDEIW